VHLSLESLSAGFWSRDARSGWTDDPRSIAARPVCARDKRASRGVSGWAWKSRIVRRKSVQQKRPLRRNGIQWYPARSDLASGLTHPSHTPRAEDRRGPPRFPQARFRGPQRHLRHAGTSMGVGVRTPWLSLAPDTNPARSSRSLALTERDDAHGCHERFSPMCAARAPC
jgi:hypothetical protein